MKNCVLPRWDVALWMLAVLLSGLGSPGAFGDDLVRDLQTTAWQSGKAAWGHWGTDPQKYATWATHSNRLIPIYTFGITLDSVSGNNSVYRDQERLARLYGQVPANTYHPEATWFDQTDVYRLQEQAVAEGKKYVILVVFDGMDWPTTWAASVYKSGRVAYREGRGKGLGFQDYRGTVTDFGYFVTSPHNSGTKVDVNGQVVLNPGGRMRGGYDWRRGGATPWAVPADPEYLLSRSRDMPHAYTDSASSATSMTAGIKTYNDSINIDWQGNQVSTIAHRLQQQGFAIGVVTSVPISHATPASAYSHNVSRSDYQDLSRDLLGLPSVSHRGEPLQGVDVLLGAGWGIQADKDTKQGTNFEPGNKFLTDADLKAVDVQSGGPYVVAQRTTGKQGSQLLRSAAAESIRTKKRLFGFFGTSSQHLPNRTADGDYRPTIGSKGTEKYSAEDITENPTLAEMTQVALEVLSAQGRGFWLMVEPGDVDWANHENNIDNSIGAVLSGDEAFREITRWAEANQCWDETAVIVTADHGHYFFLDDPAAIIPAAD